MRLVTFGIIALFPAIHAGAAEPNQDFSGLWKLNPARSEIQPSVPADAFLKVEQSAASVTSSASSQESGPFTLSTFPLDGRTQKQRTGESDASTTTKWEGAALLVNTVVSGTQTYTVMERWTRSRDGNTLTIRRTIVRLPGETESTLVYDRPGSGVLSTSNAVAPAAVPDAPRTATAPRMLMPASGAPPATSPAPREYVVDEGTRILLRLTKPINTKDTAPGDRVFLETAAPVFVDGRLLIPRGSYVAGTVTESKQAGRIKGRSALSLRFETLTLPNGVTRDFRSRPASADGHGDLERSEGRIEGDGNKPINRRTIEETTAAGAGIGAGVGAAAGHIGLGAGIGAAAGAAAGLAGVLMSRGANVVLPQGTTMELVLDRDLRFTAAELPNGN